MYTIWSILLFPRPQKEATYFIASPRFGRFIVMTIDNLADSLTRLHGWSSEINKLLKAKLKCCCCHRRRRCCLLLLDVLQEYQVFSAMAAIRWPKSSSVFVIFFYSAATGLAFLMHVVHFGRNIYIYILQFNYRRPLQGPCPLNRLPLRLCIQ